MEKINIVELLKDCPKGMELDCTTFEGLEFDSIADNEYLPICCRIKNPNGGYNIYNFTKYGCWLDADFAKCVIFPKDKTTWEGFVPPCKFKDGDILATDLGSVFYLNTRLNTDGYYGCYVGIGGDGTFHIFEPFAYKECCGLATEEEKQKLFDAIKANCYKWVPETKTLEKLIEPKFKVGDKIANDDYVVEITEIDSEDEVYVYESKVGGIGGILFSEQDDWELVPNKFDINSLKPFDKVLVRDNNEQLWLADLFGFYGVTPYPFMCVGHYTNQCIPY